MVTIVCLSAAVSCTLHGPGRFQVRPAQPEYVLERPDARRIPFRDVLSDFAPSGDGWVDLQPGMRLRIESAVFRPGSRKLSDYLGTESARYRIATGGRLVETEPSAPLPNRPADQPRPDQILPQSRRDRPRHRLFYQMLLNPTDTERRAVLVSASDAERLDESARELLADGQCGACTIFPKDSAVSVEIEITVDDQPRTVLWGTRLGKLVRRGENAKLFRPHQGRLQRVKLDPIDRQALAIPLLPGDRIER